MQRGGRTSTPPAGQRWRYYQGKIELLRKMGKKNEMGIEQTTDLIVNFTRAEKRFQRWCISTHFLWQRCQCWPWSERQVYSSNQGVVIILCLDRGAILEIKQEVDQKQHALYALHVILLSNNTKGQTTSKCTVHWISFLYCFLATQTSIFLHQLYSGGKQRCMPHMPCCFLFLVTAIVTIGCWPYLCSGGAYDL